MLRCAVGFIDITVGRVVQAELAANHDTEVWSDISTKVPGGQTRRHTNQADHYMFRKGLTFSGRGGQRLPWD